MDKLRLTLYALMLVSLTAPFFFRPTVHVKPSPEVVDAYNFIDNLPDGCRVLFSVDYGPSSQPETHPMVIAIARHLFKKRCKIAVMTLWRFEGIMMGNDAMNYVTKKTGAKYGDDWVMLGFRPGVTAVLTNIGTDFKSVFGVDINGTPIDSFAWLKDVETVKDFNLVVDFAAGATADSWVMITGARYSVPIILGTTAVIAPAMYPYYQAGQIEGILGGLKGAADYEYLIKHPEMATTGMLAQTGGHIVILIFIVIGNILYFFGRRRR